jgi:general secretion pathway protein G
LIELVVVLLIIGLLSGLAMPRLATLYTRFQFSLEQEEMITRISQLGYQAFQKASDLKLVSYPPPPESTESSPLELPVGWRLKTDQPILFRSNGSCSGGTVYLIYQDQEIVLKLNPPFCQVSS